MIASWGVFKLSFFRTTVTQVSPRARASSIALHRHSINRENLLICFTSADPNLSASFTVFQMTWSFYFHATTPWLPEFFQSPCSQKCAQHRECNFFFTASSIFLWYKISESTCLVMIQVPPWATACSAIDSPSYDNLFSMGLRFPFVTKMLNKLSTQPYSYLPFRKSGMWNSVEPGYGFFYLPQEITSAFCYSTGVLLIDIFDCMDGSWNKLVFYFFNSI